MHYVHRGSLMSDFCTYYLDLYTMRSTVIEVLFSIGAT